MVTLTGFETAAMLATAVNDVPGRANGSTERLLVQR